VNLKALLPLFIIMVALATPVYAAIGNPDTLCSAISTDLNTAGGCVDEDGFEDATTSTLAIGMLEVGDSSGLIILMVVIAIIVSVLVGAVTAVIILGKKTGLSK